MRNNKVEYPEHVNIPPPPHLIIIPSPPLLLLIPLLQLTLHVHAYNPADDFAVNCGSSGNTIFQNRNWLGDVDPTLFSTTSPQPSSLTLDSPTSPSADQVPYATARIFPSQFTYSFPLKTNGPKFLRLHFYPTSYSTNFQPYNSLFSVVSTNFTLLNHFNASLWLPQSVDYDTAAIEYIINVPGLLLNLTFIPDTNYYAFVNGIEVVSMPPFLYYSDPNASPYQAVNLVGLGTGTTYQVESKRALQMLYRVNVGQNQVPPAQDTGMFRDWETDARYIEVQHPQSISGGFGLHLNFKNNTIPDYTAPEAVYLTARSYGRTATQNYNVTWRFQLDSEFFYVLRLHFCEFDSKVQVYGARRFQIFIAEMLAEEEADVIGWSGGNLIPTHRDYAVQILSPHGHSSTKVNLTIKLQRLPDVKKTGYHDVLLNGIEIFKISDDNNNLAGPNPDPVPIPFQPLTKPPSKKKSNKTTAAVVAVSVLLVLSIVVGLIVFFRRKRITEASYKGTNKKSEGSSSLPSHLCRYFSIAEIRASTNNFDEVLVIGTGGFGDVYKGYIDDGTTPVAIKRLKQGSQQGFKEFVNEIEMLSKLRHLHLVSLIGYCNDGAEMILVYDFMPRGTLRECLYGSDDNPPLKWRQRIEILLGAARGLHYLHAGAKHNIIHRDVKSTNILLDDKWVAKVSDFGLSKVGPTGASMTHVSTVVKGSIGYLDPEYYKRQRLTLKSDVYSFGVVLLEVLCARPALIRGAEKHKASLVDWFRRCHEAGEVEGAVDPFLEGSIPPECMKGYIQLALSCLHDDGNQRPSMSDVVGALEFVLLLVGSEEEKNGGKLDGSVHNKVRSEEKAFLVEGSDVRFSSTDESGSNSRMTTVAASSGSVVESLSSGFVFSEIGDPRAR